MGQELQLAQPAAEARQGRRARAKGEEGAHGRGPALELARRPRITPEPTPWGVRGDQEQAWRQVNIVPIMRARGNRGHGQPAPRRASRELGA